MLTVMMCLSSSFLLLFFPLSWEATSFEEKKKKQKLQCVIEFELIFCELISLCAELLSEDTGL